MLDLKSLTEGDGRDSCAGKGFKLNEKFLSFTFFTFTIKVFIWGYKKVPLIFINCINYYFCEGCIVVGSNCRSPVYQEKVVIPLDRPGPPVH